MTGPRVIKAIVGLCVASLAGSAWADSSPFVGRWHWNQSRSTIPSGTTAPNDMTAEISSADSAHVRLSLTVLAPNGQRDVATFDAPGNGEFYPISGDTTAAFHLTGDTIQATFKGPAGQMDTLTCALGAGQQTMTCRGVLSDGKRRTTSYVDVFDRI
jgi:hypothetical protein